MVSDLKFLIKNILSPEDKIVINLGETQLGLGYKKAFNARSWKRLFIPSKRYNCCLINFKNHKSFDAYLQTVNGKNSAAYFARRSKKMQYEWNLFDPNEFIDDIHRIHTSKTERQGRTMDADYLTKVTYWPSDEQNQWIGVFNQDGNLVSYVWLVLLNELVLVNRILGDGNYLKDNIMYLNVLGAIEFIYNQPMVGNRYLMYDTFGRKQNGLVLFKKRIGFKPYTVKFI